MASEHVSIRMSPELLARLDKARSDARVTRSEMVKAMVEEGIRMREHPGVVFREGLEVRRAALTGGPEIWHIISALRGPGELTDEDIETAAENTGLSPYQVRTAIRYHEAYPDEIDWLIRRNDEAAEQSYAEWLARQRAVGA